MFTSTRFAYLTFGKEVGEEGTPHIQGYLVLINRARLTTLRTLIPRAHFEIARGSHAQAAHYCQKDGDFQEFGTLPTDSRGNATAFEDFLAWALAIHTSTGFAPTERDIAQAFPGLYVRYSRSLMSLIEHNCPFPALEVGTLLPWQQELWDYLDLPPDDRTITFVVDARGGKGKSWFARYMFSKKPSETQLLSVGKRDDLAHAVNCSKRFFFFNVPRGGMEFLQYTILEQLKDRVIFSPKYNSATKILNHIPHVVVLCNEMPDMGKMTQDRYNLIDI